MTETVDKQSLISGYYTGALYYDPSLAKNGFPGEGHTDGNVICVKTHFPFIDYEPSTYKPKKFLVIVRHPVKATISEMTRTLTGSHSSGDVNPGELKKMAEKQTERFVKGWEEFHKYYLNLNKTKPVKFLSYSYLKRDTFAAMREILDFLNVSQTVRFVIKLLSI